MSKPLVTKGLIEDLEKTFPDKCPRENATDREIWMAVGAVNVVKYLKRLHESQTKNVLPE